MATDQTDRPAGDGPVLVTGATGYIGGLLVPELLRRGRTVRVLSRSADRIAELDWGDAVEVAEGDASDGDDVAAALEGVDVAYYLLHSMAGGDDFEERDRELARTFATAAAQQGVRRLVYLGGLHPDGELSPHLASRVEVGKILLDSGVPTAVLQAGVVLGDGSASFDMLRYLTERLPVVVAPRWLRNRIQPIAADDVVHYLAEAADLPAELNRTFDVGGPDVLTYAEMMERFAALTDLGPRYIATVPVLTPELASLWVGLVTPVDSGVARPLVGSLIHDAVRSEEDLDDLVPPPPGGAAGFDEAVRRATRDMHLSLSAQGARLGAGAIGAAVSLGSAATAPARGVLRRLRS